MPPVCSLSLNQNAAADVVAGTAAAEDRARVAHAAAAARAQLAAAAHTAAARAATAGPDPVRSERFDSAPGLTRRQELAGRVQRLRGELSEAQAAVAEAETRSTAGSAAADTARARTCCLDTVSGLAV
jgi:hypothetical protein